MVRIATPSVNSSNEIIYLTPLSLFYDKVKDGYEPDPSKFRTDPAYFWRILLQDLFLSSFLAVSTVL